MKYLLYFWCAIFFNRQFWSREESVEVTGFFAFLHIRMIGYFMLGKGKWLPRRVRKLKLALQLEHSAGARNRRKAT